MNISSTLDMNNGVQVPILGYGTYKLEGNKEAAIALNAAIEIGYRHIDTAALYNNEIEVGQAVKNSGIDRDKFFITTKLWNSDHGYNKAVKAFNDSLRRLNMDYVDLYLIHWPVEELRMDSWKALEKIYSEGKTRSIGVSNYTIRHLEELENVEIPPAVNQVEMSPFLYQKDLLDYCSRKKIIVEAYSPLTRGRRLNDALLANIGSNYGKTPAQILIRWALQKGMVVLPKSSNPKRIKENADVFDFTLSDEHISKLDSLNENYRVAWDPSKIV